MMSANQPEEKTLEGHHCGEAAGSQPPIKPSWLHLMTWIMLVSLAWLACGCAVTHPARPSPGRAFAFPQDTFAYANELVWEYGWDAEGRWRGRPRDPEPEYSHRCFVVARATKQFFLHARFDPSAPPVDDLTYRRLVRAVLRTSPIKADSASIGIPGYANLHEFSAEHESLLKAEAGGPWKSYFQRGHWRMILPFTRASQLKTAGRLLQAISQGHPAVAHLVCFPSLRINHAVVAFAAEEQRKTITFQVYDPNSPNQPEQLTFDREDRTFHFPATDYFPGGPVNVYEVYRALCY